MRRIDFENIFETIASKPRPHHYDFAYGVLPAMAFSAPALFVMHLHGEQREKILREIWAMVGNDLPEEQRLMPEGMHCDYSFHGSYLIIIVTMPRALRHNEAHMMALAFGPLDEVGEETLDELQLRYFTLERGYSDSPDRPRTTLAEWRHGPRQRLRYGDGPTPSPSAFSHAVSELLDAGDEVDVESATSFEQA